MPKLSATASAAIDTGDITATQRIWNSELGALNKRLSDLRGGEGWAGVWARSINSRQYIDNRVGRPYTQNVNGFEIGVDRQIQVNGGRWHVGVLGGYTKANRYFKTDGKGDSSSVHGGGYATYLADNGVYASSVVTANRFRHGFVSMGSDGRASSARFGNNGAGLSLETGRRWELAHAWFVEPQAGADYFHAGGAQYKTSNGMQVKSHAGHAVQLRTSTRVGRAMTLRDGSVVSPYTQLGWVQELANKSRVDANGTAITSSMTGGRLEASVGVKASLGKKHHLYADYEYAKGRNYEQPWAFNAGYRYTW